MVAFSKGAHYMSGILATIALHREQVNPEHKGKDQQKWGHEEGRKEGEHAIRIPSDSLSDIARHLSVYFTFTLRWL
jgi:hypothetical protein